MANGMIERFHRQLKAIPQYNRLAELVYGTTLRVPGEFFAFNVDIFCDPSSYVAKLKESVRHLRASPPRLHQRASYVSDGLQTCTHAFV